MGTWWQNPSTLDFGLKNQDEYDRAADAILAGRTKPKRTPRVAPPEEPDQLRFVVDFESTIRKQILQMAQATDSRLRQMLEEAYAAGFNHAADEAGYCCGCNVHVSHDPKGYVDALIERLKEA